MDIDCLLWLQGLRDGLGGALDGVASAISFLGDSVVPMLALCAVYWCVQKEAGLYAYLGFGVGSFLNGVMKLIFCTYRPWVRDPRVMPVASALPGATGYSFPSGHSTNAVTVYGGFAVKCGGRKLLRGLLIALALLILFSRCFLGVHTPQDVVVGAALGAVSLALAGRLLRWAEGGKNRDLRAAAVITALVAAGVLFVTLKGYPMDYANGALLVDPAQMQPDTYLAAGLLAGAVWGWALERRRARFDTKRPVWQRLLRFATGAAVIALLYLVAKKGLDAALGRNFGHLVTMLMVSFYAVGLHPVLFTRAERRLDRKKAAPDARADA